MYGHGVMEVGICNFKEDGLSIKKLTFANRKLNACRLIYNSRYFSQSHTWLGDHVPSMKQGNVAHYVSH